MSKGTLSSLLQRSSMFSRMVGSLLLCGTHAPSAQAQEWWEQLFLVPSHEQVTPRPPSQNSRYEVGPRWLQLGLQVLREGRKGSRNAASVEQSITAFMHLDPDRLLEVLHYNSFSYNEQLTEGAAVFATRHLLDTTSKRAVREYVEQYNIRKKERPFLFEEIFHQSLASFYDSVKDHLYHLQEQQKKHPSGLLNNYQDQSFPDRSVEQEGRSNVKVVFPEGKGKSRNYHNRVAADIVQEVQSIHREYEQLFQVHTHVDVTLNLLSDRQFKEQARNGWAGAEYWPEEKRILLPIDTEEEESLFVVLRHEYLHAFFDSLSKEKELPRWFDEGVAAVIEHPFRSQGYEEAKEEWLSKVRRYPAISLSELMTRGPGEAESDANVYYGRAFLVIDCILNQFEDEGFSMIGKVAKALGKNSDTKAIFENLLFRETTTRFEQTFKRWLEESL